jgi:hypothetical protein
MPKRCCGTRRSWSSRSRNTVTRLSLRENATSVGVFYTFADEQARHDGFLADFLMRS